MVEFKEIKAKTILNKYKYRDNRFWCRYGVNPYRGCQFLDTGKCEKLERLKAEWYPCYEMRK